MKQNLTHHIQDFFTYIIFEKGFSHNTRDAYIRDLNKFVDFLNYKRILDFKNVETKHVVEFLSSLKNLSESSRNRTLAAVKSFFKFLRREEIVNTNIAFNIPAAKIWQRIPEILSVEEIERMLSLPDLTSSPA